MKFQDILSGPRGHFRLQVFRRGLLVETMDEPNLIVDGSKAVLASLLGGTVTNNSVTKIGYGTSGTAPAVGNTGLTGAFIKALDQVTYPVAGTVRFAFSLASSENNGVAIQEFGLFTAGSVLIARRVRSSALNKDTDISLSGTWDITF